MINIPECSNCIHHTVCSKMKTYYDFAKEISKVCISVGDRALLKLSDCSDLSVDVRCRYYKEETIHIK